MDKNIYEIQQDIKRDTRMIRMLIKAGQAGCVIAVILAMIMILG